MADQHPPHTHRPATQRVRSVVVTPRDGGRPFLIVEIEVECQVCGGFALTLAGHHVLAITQALLEVANANQALVGPPLGEGKVERTEWQGTAPGAGKETLN